MGQNEFMYTLEFFCLLEYIDILIKKLKFLFFLFLKRPR